jgi:PAS domain S-box-containing protein
MESQIRDYLYSSSRARAENIKTFLNGQKDTAKIVSTKSIYIDYLNNPGLVSNSNLIDRQMTDIKKSDEYIIEVFIINSQGKIAMSTDKNQIGADKSTDSYFINGQKDIYIKDTYYSTFISKLNYVVAAPIIDSVTNKTLGVSVIRYNPEVYYRLVDSENGMGKTEENFLVNHDKYFISPSLFLGESVILTKKVDTENVNNCYSKLEVDYVNKNGYSGLKQYLNGDIVVEAKDYRNVDVIATHDYITETGWCLVTKVDKSEFMAPIYQLITTTLLVIAGSVIIWIMLSLFIVSRLTKPISKLTQTVKNAIEGDLSVRSNNKSKNEIGRLAQNFNMLLQKITDTNSSINKQVDDQTHEILLRDTELNDRQSTILNILDDIEDEKTKAEILADDLKKFQMAVEGASDHIVITDPDGVVLFANSGAERISGYSKAEIIGKKAGSSELWGGQMSIEIYKKFWETIKIDKKAYSGVFDNIRKSGEKYEAVATITPILNELNEVIYFVGIERDVTKEKEIDRTKTEFVSLASHQLRTPLSAINWYAEMILDGDAGKINKQQRLYLSEIYRGNQRMVELVNSLLNVSRLDLGTFEIKPQLFDIGLIIDDIANEMKHSLIEKNQKLITNKPDDIPKINADQKLMRIIMQNLISNAIKYSPKNSNITVSITYNSDNIKSAFEIKITDHGYGIPNDQKDKIFTKLFRADNVRELDTEGTGLGLYIVKSILDEADGKISFTSVEKKGTTFTVTLPKSGMKQKSGDKTIN